MRSENLMLMGLVFLSLFSFSFAATGEDVEESINTAICTMVNLVKSIMAAVFLILIVLAAIIYAAGQVLGAETRARANVWATTMFVGAIIGGLIFLIVPIFLAELLGQDISEACEEFE